MIDTVAPTTPIKPTDTTPTTTTVSPTSVTPPDSTTLSPTSPTSPTTTTPTPTPNTVLSPDSSTLHTTTKDAVTEANPEEDVAPDVKVGEDDLLAKTPTEDTRITSTPEREATTKDGFQIQSALTTSAPTTLIKPITTTSTTTTTTIPPDSLVPSVGCYNPCLEVITITIPEPECKIALDPPAVVIT